MISLLSPAKTLDFETNYNFSQNTIPDFLEDSQELILELRKMNCKDISKTMTLSDKLSELNFKRYQSWDTDFHISNARQSIFCFKGGVYKGLNVDNFTENDLLYSQDFLRILSGLHGVLRPLDLIKPYRLEMGTKLNNKKGKNLYEFWGEQITESLNKSLKNNNSKYLLNLASNEYFSSINSNKIISKIINIKFLDEKSGVYKIISFFAKKARGAMAAFVIKNRIKNLNDLKNFNELGYVFDQSRSTADLLTFIR